MILFPISSLTLFMGECKSLLKCYVILYLFLLFLLGLIQLLYLFLTSPPTEKPSLPLTEQPGWALTPPSHLKHPKSNIYPILCCCCSFVFPPHQAQCLAQSRSSTNSSWLNESESAENRFKKILSTRITWVTYQNYECLSPTLRNSDSVDLVWGLRVHTSQNLIGNSNVQSG